MYPLKALLIKDSFLALVDQIISSGTNFCLTLLIAQKLDIKSFGLYSSVLLITYLLLSVNNALIIQPFQVIIAKTQYKEQYITSLFFGILILLFFSLITIEFFFQFFNGKRLFQINSVAVICFTIGFLINDFFRKLLLGISKIKRVLFIDVLFLILTFLFLIIKQINLSQVLLLIGVINLISTVPGFVFIIKNYQKPVLWRLFVTDHLKQGKWLLSVAILQWCSSNFFILISGIYLGIEALGALRLVQSFFGIINIGLQTIENYFLPKIASIYANNIVKAKKYLSKLTLIGALGFGLFTFLFFIFSDQIIVVAGGLKYQHYGYVIKMVALLYFFIFLGYPVRIMVRILMLNKVFFTGYLLSFFASLASFHFLLKYSGLYGAVTGLIINQVIMILYWQYQLNKKQL
jgi:O-antigen/teichoic acid export membrane protein